MSSPQEVGTITDEFIGMTESLAAAELVANTTVMVLAGGQGTRIKDITRDEIPKCLVELDDGVTHLDRLLDGLEGEGFRDYVFCLGYFSDQVERHLGRRNPSNPEVTYRTSNETQPLGTGGALALAVGSLAIEKPFLVVTSDAVFPYDELTGLRSHHEPGSVSWAMSHESVSTMEQHRTMLFDEVSGAIIQNVKRPRVSEAVLEELMQPESRKVLIDSGHGIIDPELLMRAYSAEQQRIGSDTVCWYKDIIPFLAEETRQQLLAGRAPVLRGYVEVKPVLDVGTLVTHHFANDELAKPDGYFAQNQSGPAQS